MSLASVQDDQSSLPACSIYETWSSQHKNVPTSLQNRQEGSNVLRLRMPEVLFLYVVANIVSNWSKQINASLLPANFVAHVSIIIIYK